MAIIALLPSNAMSQLSVPFDAQSLARHELQKIAALTQAGLQHPNLDLETRAHLETVRVRVRQALDAKTALPL
jgi:hypothetical protein